MLNARGTSATTDVALGDGDDRIYVASQADADLDSAPEFLRGDLDAILGTLNLDAGRGRNTLMISDEASATGDGAVLITRSGADMLVTGLAPKPISYRAAADGTFAGGITYWTGSGNDTITIDATHLRPGVQTLTALNTGLGNDVVTVDVDAGEDDALVIDTQGAVQHVLPIAGGLSSGDHHAPADVVGVWIDGVPLGCRRVRRPPRDSARSACSSTRRSARSSSSGIERSIVLGFTVDGLVLAVADDDAVRSRRRTSSAATTTPSTRRRRRCRS